MDTRPPCDDLCLDPASAPCECVWICERGRTRLSCQLRANREQDYELEVLRNGRLYGTYRFGERLTAVTFASRLRHTFEGNGWTASPSR